MGMRPVKHGGCATMSKLFSFDLEEDVLDPRVASVPGQSHNELNSPEPAKTNSTAGYVSRHQGQLQHRSQMSLVAKYMALDPVALHAFEERAAILEFDQGFTREVAEMEAFRRVMKEFQDSA